MREREGESIDVTVCQFIHLNPEKEYIYTTHIFLFFVYIYTYIYLKIYTSDVNRTVCSTERREQLNEMTRRVEYKPNEMMKTVRHDEMGSMNGTRYAKNLHSPNADMVWKRDRINVYYTYTQRDAMLSGFFSYCCQCHQPVSSGIGCEYIDGCDGIEMLCGKDCEN